MRRILKAYANRFRTLLLQAGARRIEQGVRLLCARANRFRADEGISLTHALEREYGRLRHRMEQRASSAAVCARRNPSGPAPRPGAGPPPQNATTCRFWCDAGLGGLARWLRAAGYASHWQPHIDDRDLLERARTDSAILLTTDSLLMERRVLRDGVIPAFWLPPTLTVAEQLRMLARELPLERRAPRCMRCGGELRTGDKETLRERIPPRTYLWRNEYFVCVRCGQLFWHGTHWQRIDRLLESVLPTQAPPEPKSEGRAPASPK